MSYLILYLWNVDSFDAPRVCYEEFETSQEVEECIRMIENDTHSFRRERVLEVFEIKKKLQVNHINITGIEGPLPCLVDT